MVPISLAIDPTVVLYSDYSNTRKPPLSTHLSKSQIPRPQRRKRTQHGRHNMPRERCVCSIRLRIIREQEDIPHHNGTVFDNVEVVVVRGRADGRWQIPPDSIR